MEAASNSQSEKRGFSFSPVNTLDEELLDAL
jgi:hypothetical protein